MDRVGRGEPEIDRPGAERGPGSNLRAVPYLGLIAS